MEKAPAIKGRGKVTERLEVEIRKIFKDAFAAAGTAAQRLRGRSRRAGSRASGCGGSGC
jgi:hypothetical protein